MLLTQSSALSVLLFSVCSEDLNSETILLFLYIYFLCSPRYQHFRLFLPHSILFLSWKQGFLNPSEYFKEFLNVFSPITCCTISLICSMLDFSIFPILKLASRLGMHLPECLMSFCSPHHCGFRKAHSQMYGKRAEGCAWGSRAPAYSRCSSSKAKLHTCPSSISWLTDSKVRWKLLSHVWLVVTPRTVHSMEFFRPEYWRG